MGRLSNIRRTRFVRERIDHLRSGQDDPRASSECKGKENNNDDERKLVFAHEKEKEIKRRHRAVKILILIISGREAKIKRKLTK